MALKTAPRSRRRTGSRTAAWQAILALAFMFVAGLEFAWAGEALDSLDLKGHGGPVKTIAVAPDGERAVTGSFDYAMIVWQLDAKPPAVAHRFLDHDAAVNAVALVPGAQRAVTGSDDGTVGVFDLAQGRLVKRLGGHAMKVVAVAVSPDARWALSGAWDRTARLWNLESLEPGPVLAGHANTVNAVAFTADGAHALTAGYDGTLRLWRVADGAEERIVYRHGWGLNAVVVLGGDKVFIGGLDGTVGLVDLSTGELTRTIATRERPILALALNADGRLAAASGGDGIVEVYETEGWHLVNTLDNPLGPVWALAFTASDSALYLGGLDDDVHYWQFRPGRDFEPMLGEFPRRFQVSEGVSAGELQFRRKCSICHTLEADGGNRAGPTLYRVFGRRAGSLAGYVYSETLSGSQIVWNEVTIERLFAEGPEHFIPGSKMPLQKMTRADERAALIAYLKQATGSVEQE